MKNQTVKAQVITVAGKSATAEIITSPAGTLRPYTATGSRPDMMGGRSLSYERITSQQSTPKLREDYPNDELLKGCLGSELLYFMKITRRSFFLPQEN